MTQDNGWTCCGIPNPKETEFDWREKAAEEEETPEKETEEAQD